VAFYFDGSQGICIHPSVWHEAIIPLTDNARFYDKQGKVHARISCDFGKEFGVLLSVPLHA
jgi:ureidoglycolate hydrolase